MLKKNVTNSKEKNMSEKRFKYKITDGFLDVKVPISIKEVVDLLNEQAEQIEKWKWVAEVKQKVIDKMENEQ